MYNDSELNKILFYALQSCGEYLRKNPPGDLDQILMAPDNMIGVLAGGSERDPKGREWVSYWIKQGMKKYEARKNES